MNEQTVNALEILMITTLIFFRVAGTCAIVWLIVGAEITNGWKVFLIALSIVVGLSSSLKYQNPNAKCDKCLFTEAQSEIDK